MIEEKDEKSSFSKFKVIKTLGKGCQAEVLQVQDITSLQRFAVKVIRTIGLQQKQKQRVEFEVRSNLYLSNMLQSKYFPKMHQYFQTQQSIQIVFQLCEENAETAFKRLATYTQRYNFLVVMIFDMLNALRELEQLKIIHRDIKPQNILLKDGEFKLADLGLSRLVQVQNRCFTNNIGNRLGRSPQFVTGRYSEKADIWSLAIHLFYLFESTLPFDPLSIAKIRNNPNDIQKIISSPDLSIDLQARGRRSKNILSFIHLVLSDMLVIDPEHRKTASEIIAQHYSIDTIKNSSEITRWLLLNYLSQRDSFGEFYLILLLGNQEFYRMDNKLKDDSQPNKRIICLKVKNVICQIVRLLVFHSRNWIQGNQALVYSIDWILQQWQKDLDVNLEKESQRIKEIDEVLNLFKISKVRQKFPLLEWIVKLFKIATLRIRKQPQMRLNLWDIPVQLYKMI